MFSRHQLNPLITPQKVKPSRPGFEIIGTFNAGVTQFKGEVLLLVRVAERPINPNAEVIICPYFDANGELVLREIQRNDPNYDTTDPRKVEHHQTGEILLTSVSHLRLARSRDGVNFEIAETPWLVSSVPEEAFGIEDARITQIDDTFYVNYTAVSSMGIATGLLSTQDFVTLERQGIIFPPDNRDVTIFPVKIGGQYSCYHRPMPGMFGSYNIWAASSPDLIHWGKHQKVLTTSQDGWESGRVGGGAPPVRTERGWLSIYHAADRQDRYCLGAFLTSHDDPATVIARSRKPVFSPEASYEIDGFFSNVVFTCGAIIQGDQLHVYYGAADETIALASAPLQAILDSLEA